ncbi:tyrosine-type recombinase/integrase [Chloroflexota bacterium]
MASSSLPAQLTHDNNTLVNDIVSKIIAMTYAQGKPQQPTEFLTIGSLQIGTPIVKQQWVDDFLASRRQGLSDRTSEFYQSILYQFVGVELTPKGINNWLTNLNCGNAKFSYYRAVKAFCNWLYKSKKIVKNPIALIDRPKVSKRLLPAITAKQLETLKSTTDNLRDKCIVQFLFDSGCRLSEVAGIKDTDFNWEKRTVTVIGKGNKQREAPFTKETGEMLKQWFSQHKTFELKGWGVQTMLKKLEQKTGITCNAHCFRRGFAIHQLKRGLSTRVMQSLGGWESITMVEQYSKQLSQDDTLELYSKE